MVVFFSILLIKNVFSRVPRGFLELWLRLIFWVETSLCPHVLGIVPCFQRLKTSPLLMKLLVPILTVFCELLSVLFWELGFFLLNCFSFDGVFCICFSAYPFSGFCCNYCSRSLSSLLELITAFYSIVSATSDAKLKGNFNNAHDS